MVRLHNKQPSAQFLATEYHDIVCQARNQCGCRVQHVVSKGGKRISKKLPASFHIEVGGYRDVDNAVMHLPQVKQAVKRGDLVREDLGAPAAPAASRAAKKQTKKSAAPSGGQE